MAGFVRVEKLSIGCRKSDVRVLCLLMLLCM
jgi:hypothetical protein